MYESLQQLDSLRINFAQSDALNFVLAFIMFGVALGIRLSEFKKLILSPKPVLVGVLSQFVALPCVTFLLVLAFHRLLPPMVAGRLRKLFPRVKMRSYYTNAALLLGVESRTSSPVRIPRDPETLQYVSLPGLFPCGEGAGYAGGIVSSALDGINVASAVAASL